MVHKPDTPCIRCTKMLHSGRGSLPADQRMCRACRYETSARNRICVVCDAPFRANDATAKTCGHECAVEYRKLRRYGDAPRSKDRVCEICDVLYVAKWYLQRTCGRACGQRLRDKEGTNGRKPEGAKVRAVRLSDVRSRVWVHPCARCECLYVSRRSDSKFCSPECRQKVKPLTQRICRECQAPFAANGNRVYCSAICGRRAGTRAHRSRHGKFRIATSKRITIYINDGWRCHLCHELVDMDAADGTNWSDTLDHLIPRSRGGSNAVENLATAHQWCNSWRGDRPLEVVRPFFEKGLKPPSQGSDLLV